jgi:ribosome assembly protein YihI (activator of Der GTPase)
MTSRDSIEELIKRSKLAAQKLGLEATGKHRKEPNQKRQFEIKNPVTGEVKWSRLGHLEFGSNPWGVPTIDDKLDRVKRYANELGLEATGVHERKTNARYFEVRHPDGRTKFTTLRNLQDQKNPFGKQTLDEQINDAKAGASVRGLKVTGKFQLQGKGNRRIFEVVTPSGRAVHMQLGAIRQGFAPRISQGEQLKLASNYAQKIGISTTGRTRRSDSGATLFEVTNGVEATFSQLSHLKLGQNPWQAPFKINKTGYFYVYEIIHKEKKFLGFGVTNNHQRRHSDHLMECRKEGAKIRRIELIQMHGAKCLELETSIKRLIKTSEHVEIIGFKTESAPYTDELLQRIKAKMETYLEEERSS